MVMIRKIGFRVGITLFAMLIVVSETLATSDSSSSSSSSSEQIKLAYSGSGMRVSWISQKSSFGSDVMQGRVSFGLISGNY